MYHKEAGSISWTPAPTENFTGRAWFGTMAVADDPMGLVAIGVLFEPGARTDWHHHPEGQTLLVASGSGFVQNAEGETAAIHPGDTVSVPAGETHWHGASDRSYLMHISVTTGGPTTWVDEKVDADIYDTAGSSADGLVR